MADPVAANRPSVEEVKDSLEEMPDISAEKWRVVSRCVAPWISKGLNI